MSRKLEPPTAPTPTRRLRPQADIAEYLGVSERTVQRMVVSGQLIAYRMGSKLVRIDLNDVEALLQRVPVGGHDAGK